MPRSNRPTAIFAIAFLGGLACSRTGNVGNTSNLGTPQTDGSIAGHDVVSQVGGDTAPSVFCRPFGQTCASGQDCCSGLCDPLSSTCVASINKCTATGGACATST